MTYDLEVYIKFVEGYNADIWPLHVPAMGLALAAVWLLWRGGSYKDPLIGLILAVLWGWSGIVYYGQELSMLSFFAIPYAVLFTLQAALVLLMGARGSLDLRYNGTRRDKAGLALCGFALIVYPVMIALIEGNWQGFRVPGLTPGPTALLTLGLLLTAKGSTRRTITCALIPIFYLIAAFVVFQVLPDV